jgi:Cu+-exporting ATPase
MAVPPGHASYGGIARADVLRIAGLGTAGAVLGPGHWDAFGHPWLFSSAATLMGGYPILREGVDGALARRMTTALSMTIALVSLLVMGEGLAAVLMTALASVTGVLETLTVSRRRDTARPLQHGVPRQVRCHRNTGYELAPIETLRKGDVIIDAVEHTAQPRAPIQAVVDRLAGYLVHVVMAAAAAIFVLTRDLRATVSVLIVAGASGVVIGIPLAIRAAIGRAARSGAIIRGGVDLEALWSIDTAVLDDVGAITVGEVRVRAVYPAVDVSVRDVLEAAAIAESRSTHPIGVAIIEYAAQNRVPVREPTTFSYTPGHGVRARYGAEEILVGNSGFVTSGRFADPANDPGGSSTVFVVRGGRYLGSVAVAEMPRPEARQAIADLRSLGVKTYLFTADSSTATERMAHDLFVDDFETGLVPEAKLARVQALARTRRVAVVQDGANNAPSLAAAMVGVTMGSWRDPARDSADVMLIGDDLGTFVDVVRLARRTHAIILQNAVGTLIVNGAGLVLAAGGGLTPVVAALIHITSRGVFLLNAGRVLPVGPIETGQPMSR